VDDEPDDVSLGDDGVDCLTLEGTAVVAQKRESILAESAAPDAEGMALRTGPFEYGTIVDKEDTLDEFDLFAWQPDDALDDEFTLTPGDHQIPAVRFPILEGPPVGQEQIAVVQSGMHAVSDNQDEAELGLKGKQTGDESQARESEAERSGTSSGDCHGHGGLIRASMDGAS
jgi:hypothetical protein